MIFVLWGNVAKHKHHIIDKKEGVKVAVIKGEIIKKELLEYLNNLIN